MKSWARLTIELIACVLLAPFVVLAWAFVGFVLFGCALVGFALERMEARRLRKLRSYEQYRLPKHWRPQQ